LTNIILASASPRRRALLEQIGVAAEIRPADIDETPRKGETPALYARRMAVSKAEKIAADHPDAFVLAADTVVACGARILPKAENADQVRDCLNLLSGRRHTVYGGICLITPDGRKIARVARTSVVFARLHESEKRAYSDGGEGLGKAGGYAIQGKAALFVRQIIGSYTNVVGLDVYEAGRMLKGNGAF